MQTAYSYSLVTDFPNGLIPVQLQKEIEADGNINISVESIVIISEEGITQDVSIVFESELPSDELTRLNTVVIPAHSPAVFQSDHAVQLEGTSDSNFTTTSGDLTLEAESGIVKIYGSDGIIRFQGDPTSLPDSDGVLTLSQIQGQLFVGSPTLLRTFTIDDAVSISTGMAVNDAIDFHVVNQGSASIRISVGDGGTLIGVDTILLNTASEFRLRITGSDSYILYRLA